MTYCMCVPYIHVANSYKHQTQNRALAAPCMFLYIHSVMMRLWDGTYHNANHTLPLETFFHLVSRIPHTSDFLPVSTATHSKSLYCFFLISWTLKLWLFQALDLGSFFYIKSSLHLLNYFHGYKHSIYIRNSLIYIASFDSALNFRFVYPADVLTSPFECLADMSDLAEAKLNARFLLETYSSCSLSCFSNRQFIFFQLLRLKFWESCLASLPPPTFPD